MRAKTLHHAAAMLPLVYAPLAAGPALEARAEPPAHRKEAATAEDRAHDPEGEGEPLEAAHAGEGTVRGATGPSGNIPGAAIGEATGSARIVGPGNIPGAAIGESTGSAQIVDGNAGATGPVAARGYPQGAAGLTGGPPPRARRNGDKVG